MSQSSSRCEQYRTRLLELDDEADEREEAENGNGEACDDRELLQDLHAADDQ